MRSSLTRRSGKETLKDELSVQPNPPGLPPAFLDRLRMIVPPDRLDAVLASFHEPPVTAFRVNTLRADVEGVLAEIEAEGLLPQKVSWKSDAFWVEPNERQRLLGTKAFQEGRIYIQNLSSMIPPMVLGARPGERVLDLAAAPGSKTLQLACDMQSQGELAAVEVVRIRFFKMRDNLKAQGADQVRTFLKNGEDVWRHRPEYFDRVLLDAPCSTEGRFSSEDEGSWSYWSIRKIREMVRKQRRLLYSAVQSLRPGGTLVYSTCTFAPEENEEAVADVLKKFGDGLQAIPITPEIPGMMAPLSRWNGHVFPDAVAHARRILPDHLMEGFFVCCFEKTRSTLTGPR